MRGNLGTSKLIVVGDRVWCGVNVTIMKGIHIRAGAVIAASAVVIRAISERTVVAGVPEKSNS